VRTLYHTAAGMLRREGVRGNGRGIDMTEDQQRFELLADLGAMIAREVELDELLGTFAARVADAIRADRATLWMVDGATGDLRSRVAILPELDELRVPAGQGLVGHVAATGQLVNIPDASRDPRWNRAVDLATGFRTLSVLAVPITAKGQLIGVLQMLNKKAGAPGETLPGPIAFTREDEAFARALAEQIARALDYTSLRGNQGRRGVRISGRFNHVVGHSPVMHAVYELVERAAATDATVLVHGETGTGKGLIARAIHVNSERRDAPMIAVDCTTLPANLVESELFGHERGAYTGADARVIGKVEAAHRGTLFLDEIGELPLELQGKLLRFVQERKFERVGGRETLSADVRLVAATNRDLPAMVAAGQFRSDLFFRLRVIELELPPLRARGAGDILALADHFAGHYARRYRRGPMRISERARPILVAHPWPGNVRELEHAIERAVVLSRDGVLEIDELGLDRPPVPTRTTGTMAAAAPADLTSSGNFLRSPDPTPDTIPLPADLTLDDAERRYALAVLTRHAGNQSAAARALGISRNKLARLLREK
jgi:transcriptional regulator with GAF, ATPase, and Fis domain